MIHPASRLEVVIHSRADGRNAVKSAAYCARASYRDDRVGMRFRAGRTGGLLSHELINWKGDAEALWNRAEQVETRSNARVIRELRPSLPAELPLAEQIRLVRGFGLWLRDEYGVAVQADIHAPRFLDRVEERLHQTGKLDMPREKYLEALYDPDLTNRNFHAHILMTTREVCPIHGNFGAKTRILDDRKAGPHEIMRLRQEWEKRTNAALKRVGSNAKVDLRSYKTMTREGDAPEGLIAQDHLGPRRAARSRRLQAQGEDTSRAGKRRQAVRAFNEFTWQSWMVLRALEREKSRREAEAIARDREAARKKEADAERHRLQSSQSAEDAGEVLGNATQFDSLKTGSELAQAISWALQAKNELPSEPPDEFSSPVDLETYEAPPGPPQPRPVLEVKVRRVRGQRSR
ncbi:MobA/MobL family protein [Sulfitobacter sabulilitoris]|uniref:Conjugal transfer protein n=1 Tax=Sulfitobacter sabulilitoris TaxID=2562655 RepID=A0A5S3PL57_9RHOB|nr:MobA/MobL family protein [Sulfitobacter sabulilitoris]TMM55123.1 conjugal transfer protein [Sulfitobacter sabulilitoris]